MPAGFGVGVRVEGAQQLARLSADLKQVADKSLQRQMRRRLREAVKPIVAEVQGEAAVYSRTVARSIVAQFSYSARTAGAQIVARRSRMPPGKQSLPTLFEYGSQGSGGRYIRHPVFGNTEVWVNQPIRPYFFKTIRRHERQVQAALIAVLTDVERELKGGT